MENLCIQDQVKIVHCLSNSKNNGEFGCNRMAVKDAIFGKLSSHHFAKNHGCKVEDISGKEMSRKIYHSDFCEESTSTSQRYSWRH